MVRRYLACAAWVLLVGAGSNPPAPSQLHSYDFALGRWQCRGVTPAGATDYTFTQTVTKTLNGRWFFFHAVSREGTDDSFMTYEPKMRLWRYISVDNAGGYSVGTSSGWRSNRQTWTGHSYADGSTRSWGRITFIKVSDRSKREKFYQPSKGGTYRYMGSEICEKRD
jgi:hypothetical protein